MNKFLAIVLLGWLAADVSAGTEHEKLSDVSFGGLEAFLLEKLPHDDDNRANLDYIKENINSLEGSTKEAGEVLLELSNTADQCDNNVINHLYEIINGEPNVNGLGRVEKLLINFQDRALEACEALVEQSFKDADLSFGEFIFRIKPELMLSSSMRGRSALSGEMLGNLLEKMSSQDDRIPFKYPAYINLYNKYLVRPCERVMSRDRTLDNVLALRLYLSEGKNKSRNVRDPPARDLRVGLTEELKNLNKKKEVCEVILFEDLSEVARLVKSTA